MKKITLTPVPVTRALLEDLEREGCIRLFRPTEATQNPPEGENIGEAIYVADPAFGPHRLIAVGVNKRTPLFGTHSDCEEFLIPAYGEEVRPLYLVICKRNAADLKAGDQAETLRAEDFTCLSLYPSPRGAEMFTMLPGVIHCELTIDSPKPVGVFYVTESRDLDVTWFPLERIFLEVT